MKEIEQLRLKQNSIENFLKKAKDQSHKIDSLHSEDLESEVFNEEIHNINESIELGVNIDPEELK